MSTIPLNIYKEQINAMLKKDYDKFVIALIMIDKSMTEEDATAIYDKWYDSSYESIFDIDRFIDEK